MNTKKRNERTRRIFNGIMNAVMSAYGIKDDMDLKSIYKKLSMERNKTFYFLDTNGKIIDNTLPYREDGVEDFRDDTVKDGRKLSFLYSDEYINVLYSYDYKIRLIKSINIDDCKFNRYSTGNIKIRYVNSYDGVCSSSTVLRKLFDDYITDNYNKNNNKCLVVFETIFGSRCLARKEFDRIRYIYFTEGFSCNSDCLYNIDNESFCFGGFVTKLIKSTYQDPSIETYKSVFDNCFYIMKDALKSKREHTLKEIYKNLESVYKSVVKDVMVRNLSYEYNFMPLYNPLTNEKLQQQAFEDHYKEIDNNLLDDEKLKQRFEAKRKKFLDNIRGI